MRPILTGLYIVVHTLHTYEYVICELTYDASILARLPRPSLTTIAPGDRATRIGSTTGKDHLHYRFYTVITLKFQSVSNHKNDKMHNLSNYMYV